MVSNLQQLHIHLRLVEISGCSDNILFAGITVIAYDDLLKPTPVQKRAVYAEYHDWEKLVHLWKLLKKEELG